ncbi:transmembrane protease serine 5 isoform X4 [Oxyura jamaicensis]|uniref:transmembrane protease serine 5 isoform X4 n=1 Tax=Oxyura jamaicensis TaxID=8884 RepID=UPI0015A61A2F|nr:transmembrane protease serine 5 isoform X4 [Oxyura jamaicensis]
MDDPPEGSEPDGHQGEGRSGVRPGQTQPARQPGRHVAGQEQLRVGTDRGSEVLRRLHASGWLVGTGVARGSIEQEAGVPVEKVIYHPLYNGSSLDYDIALMKLRVPLNFSDAIRAVCLPPSHRDLFQGTPCWVSGWGYTRPDQAQLTETLKEALVPLISTRRCNSSCMYEGELTARMLCAGYPQGKIDACQGDSGGPLVCQDDLTWRLVGVVSWGQGCAEPNHPGVYTNVAQLLPWIYRTTEIY